MAGTLAEQVAVVRTECARLPAGLQSHIERVEAEAMDLAHRWDVDPVRMSLAVWGHDLFRAVPDDEQVALAERAGVPVRKADRRAPVVLHGPTAAAVLAERFEVTDAEVLQAVAQHTLGARDMPLLAKILLVADKVEAEKRRRQPAMRAIRKLARRDIDLALLCWADWKWAEERAHGWESHPVHWQARKRWVRSHHQEIGRGLR